MPDLNLNAMIRALPPEGGRIDLPRGVYDLVLPDPPCDAPPDWQPSAAVIVDRAVEIVGAGPAYGVNSATFLRVPPGVDHGFELLGAIAGEEGRTTSPVGGARSRLSGFRLEPLDRTRPYDFGITVRAYGVQLTNLHVRFAARHNIYILSTKKEFDTNGDGVADKTVIDNADHWFMHHIRTDRAGLDGVYVDGTDAHIGTAIQIDAVSNGRWGINDASSFGNLHIGHHAASNGRPPNATFTVTLVRIEQIPDSAGDDLKFGSQYATIREELEAGATARTPRWDPTVQSLTGWNEYARLYDRDPSEVLRDGTIVWPEVRKVISSDVISSDPVTYEHRVILSSQSILKTVSNEREPQYEIGNLAPGNQYFATTARYGGAYFANSGQQYGTWIGCYAEHNQAFGLVCPETSESVDAGIDPRVDLTKINRQLYRSAVRGQTVVVGGNVSGPADTNAQQVIGQSAGKASEKVYVTAKSPSVAARHLTESFAPLLISEGPFGDAEESGNVALTPFEAENSFRCLRQFKYDALYWNGLSKLDRRSGELEPPKWQKRGSWTLVEPYAGLERTWEWLEDTWFLVRRQQGTVGRPPEVPYAFTDEDHLLGPSHAVQGWSRANSPFRFSLRHPFDPVGWPVGKWQKLEVEHPLYKSVIPRRGPFGLRRSPAVRHRHPGRLSLSISVKTPVNAGVVEIGSHEHDHVNGKLGVWLRSPEAQPPRMDGGRFELQVVGERFKTPLEVRASTTSPLPAYDVDSQAAYDVDSQEGAQKMLEAIAPGPLPPQDEVSLAAGDSVLVKDETDFRRNGVCVVTNGGSPTEPWRLVRRDDMDDRADIYPGEVVAVREGRVNGGTFWVVGDIPIFTTRDPIPGQVDLFFWQFGPESGIT